MKMGKHIVACILLVNLYFICGKFIHKEKGHSTLQSGDDFVISLSTDGTYNISIKGNTWLVNAPTYFHAYNKTYNSSYGSLYLNALQNNATYRKDNGHSTLQAGDDFAISLSTDGTYNISIKVNTWLVNAPTYFHAYNKTCNSSYGSHKGHSTLQAGDDFVISLSTDGTYNISIKGNTWLVNAPTYFHAYNKTYNSSDGSLKLVESDATSGVDGLGQYQALEYQYRIKDDRVRQITARVKTYQDLPSVIIFEQDFVDGLEGTQGKTYEDICGGFPGFKIGGSTSTLGYLSYGGYMFGDTSKKMGIWNSNTSDINDGIAAGPLAIFDKSGSTLILSPFNNFMSASFSHDQNVGGNYYGGIMGGVSTIPPNYRQSFILYYGEGINKAFEGWGQVLRQYYGKDPSQQQDDPTIKYLGYWTDNGAFYYYNTEANKTYDVTMFDVKAYADQMQIPYKYYQYDSWWYYKGKGDGVKTWVARPDVFPEGFVNVTKKIGYPAAAHNRYWASDTTYAKQNGGKYDFIVEKVKALPLTEGFWLDLFTEAKNWGLVMYEQDWLDTEFSGLQALLHDLFLGSDWLTNMAEAAKLKGIFIQYCMSNPRHAMQALQYPAVTQARVSNDYNPGGNQWKIGISSIFATAMGVAPYKDTFWTTETQPGNPYKRTEPNWKLQSIVSTLSTGPVGPSDMVNGTNVDILMKCCNAEGMILKPQYPIRAIDAQIMQAAFGDVGGPHGEVWVSYTEINGLRFANLLGVDIQNGTEYTVFPNALGIYQENDSLLAVPYDEPTGPGKFSQLYGITFSDKFKPNRPALYHISPVIPGWPLTTIFGEIDKWTPMSPQRVLDLSWTSKSIMAKLQGATNEQFVMWYVLNGKPYSVTCTMNPSGAGLLKIDGSKSMASC